jgi:hypothetical protein
MQPSETLTVFSTISEEASFWALKRLMVDKYLEGLIQNVALSDEIVLQRDEKSRKTFFLRDQLFSMTQGQLWLTRQGIVERLSRLQDYWYIYDDMDRPVARGGIRKNSERLVSEGEFTQVAERYFLDPARLQRILFRLQV